MGGLKWEGPKTCRVGGGGEGCCLRSCENPKDKEVRVEPAGRIMRQDRYKVLVRTGREDSETAYQKDENDKQKRKGKTTRATKITTTKLSNH